MSEETVVTKTEETKTVEPNPHEEQARDQGWVSKEEWVADGRAESDWRPAKEFVERGEIFKSLHQVKRELKQERAAREALQAHHKFVYEKAYQEAVNNLRKERREALRAEDLAKVAEVEEKIEALNDEKAAETQRLQQQQAATAQANNITPVFQEWIGRNPWYTKDEEMREFAEAVGHIYMQKNPGFAPEDVLSHVEAKVRKQYSEKFGGRKAAPNAVAGVDRTSTRTTSTVDMVLDEMEESIMKTLVDSGTMTKDEYIKELKKAKGLK